MITTTYGNFVRNFLFAVARHFDRCSVRCLSGLALAIR
jgi:hypothetical protein